MAHRPLFLVVVASCAACVAERGALSNRMAQSGTVYLMRAAREPVGWQPWGREAFAIAARLDRPLLLYIGADDCEWCTRMDRESYADGVLGGMIDSLFVPVRVDRDEHPDVASRYQAALQSLAGIRGYPVTIFLMPDGAPFFGGTYFPKDDPVTGRGLRQILPEVARSYREERETIRRHAALVRQLVVTRSAASHGVVRPEVVAREIAAVARTVGAALTPDAARDGLGTFPYAQAVGLLLGESARFGDTLALRVARAALEMVVDSFEGAGEGRRMAGTGLLESSPGLVRALTVRNLAAASVLLGDARLSDAGRRLARAVIGGLAGTDRVAFTDREAYVIATVLEGALMLGDTAGATVARQALDRLLDSVHQPGQGVRHAVVGSVSGLLQDHVQVAAACLSAHAAFRDPRYLDVARDIASVLDRDFADPMGGYFDSVQPDPAAPALADRTKQVLDDLLPGANAWAAHVLFRLAEATGERRYARRGEATLAAFAGGIEGAGVRAASYLLAAREALDRR
jgi:uncharacterized protein YyaL (SSP411 family)